MIAILQRFSCSVLPLQALQVVHRLTYEHVAIPVANIHLL